jgi:hypothetical protein
VRVFNFHSFLTNLQNSICLYGFTYSAPTIILDLGYTAANAQLLTIPIYIVGVCSTIFFSVLADRHQTRWPFIVIPYSIAAIGFIGLLAIPHPKLPGLTYAFLFTIPGGVYPPLIGCLSWVGNNLAPTWKRAVGMAVLISIGNASAPIPAVCPPTQIVFMALGILQHMRRRRRLESPQSREKPVQFSADIVVVDFSWAAPSAPTSSLPDKRRITGSDTVWHWAWSLRPSSPPSCSESPTECSTRREIR